ncbi:MAG: Tetratricopeptide repeat protein [Methanoregulaceae archaeon PtaU1.Bin059]|nr:MAG: Tetratricopeptide repeat protein [Methanoregulaceae archaeon PtaB.Bin152]OPY39929.1 MAG: Tetratricopeptide repeat protein [Methanoregulaceae archaeon PtaU1.Bin059]
MLRIILPVLAIVLIVLACGCLAHTAQPACSQGTGPGLPAPEILNMTIGSRVIAMAVNPDEIETPYPEAKEFLIQGVQCNANGGRFTDAIDYYDRALAIDPECSIAYLAKGVSLHNLGRYDEAIACYDKAFLLDPGNEGIPGLKEISIQDRIRLGAQ